MPWSIMPSLTSSAASSDPPQEPKPAFITGRPLPDPDEKEYRFPAYLPRVWQELDILHLKDKRRPGESFWTREAGGSDSFRLKVYILPKESHYLGVRLEVHPPEHMKLPGCYWIVEDVSWEITVFNFTKIEPSKCFLLVATETFQTADDPHYVDLLRMVDLTQEKGWLDKNDHFRIRFRALLPVDDDKMTQSMKGMDLTQELIPVTFRLPDGQSLYVDKRVLVARSEYFHNMLGTDTYKEGQTNEIDLTTDPQADRKSLSAVLIYIITGSFTCDGDTAYAFSVRKLADRFVLQGLCDLVDAELESLLSTENVFDFFGEVVNTQGRLESACVGLITENNCELLEVQKEKVCRVIKSNSALAEVLFQVLLAYRQKWLSRIPH